MSAVVSLSDLINGVRDTLAAWPFTSSLNGALTDSTTTVNLAVAISNDYVGEKSYLEIDNEIMFVTEVVTTTQLTVMRGYQGSTAAAHSDAAVVKIHPYWSWTDRAIRNDYIPKAMRWLKPHAWVHGVTQDFTWSSGSFEAQVPVASQISNPHGNLIIKLERLESISGSYLPFYGWELAGPFLRFRQAASRDHTLHASMAVFQGPLPLLNDTLDNDDFEEAIVSYAAMLAMNSLKTNRARFLGYSAALNDRASTPDELIRIAFDLKNQAILSREEFSRPMPPNFIKTYKDPF